MSTSPTSASFPSSFLSWLALLVALAGSVGSVWLSVGMGYKACPLCYYQRSFMLGTFAILAIGLLGGLGRTVALSTLCLPLAVAGTAVAGRHVYLEAAGRMACPAGLFSLGSAPQQSAATFALLTVVLLLDSLADALGGRRLGGSFLTLLVAVLLGVGMEEAGVRSASILPVPDSEYENASPTICRPIRKPAS